MVTQYTDAAGQALGGLLELLMRLALPLGICAGLGAIALAVAFRRNEANGWWLGGRTALRALGYAAVAVLGLAGWAALSTVRPLARQNIQWRESAEATANPVPDAPAVYQFSPAVAALVERTYTRTLTLPPDFVQRLGEGGLGVLSPYLADPSSENVLRLVDTFRRSGRDVLFTRGVTRLDEEPIAIDRSQVRVKFRRLTGRAYELEFEGRYAFQNPRPEPITARFQLALPEAGTWTCGSAISRSRNRTRETVTSGRTG